MILTNDREFRGYVFDDRLPAHGVALLQVAIAHIPRERRMVLAIAALRGRQERLIGHFTTIYPDRIEQESLPSSAP